MKTIPASKERNKYVAAALFRKAGVHRKSNKALRKRDNQTLKTKNSVEYRLH